MADVGAEGVGRDRCRARACCVPWQQLELPLIAGPCDRDTLIGRARHRRVGDSVSLLSLRSEHCQATDRLADPDAPEHLLAEIAAMEQGDTALFAGVRTCAFGGLPVTAACSGRITGVPAG